jgi:hypothetical protein
MTEYSRDDESRTNRRSWLPLAAALRATALATGLALVGITGATAQEATPGATPGGMEMECVAVDATMAPESGMMGTPAASPMADATPAVAEGTAADETLAAEATAAIENFIACSNAGDFASVLAMMTPEYVLDLFGTDDVAAIEQALAGVPLPPTQILSIGNVMTYDDGRVSVDGEYMISDYQYSHSRIFLVQAGDTLLIDHEDFLPAMPDVEQTAIISYTIPDDTSTLAFDQSTTVPAIEGLILYGANNGAERHSVALLRLPDEAAGTPVAEIGMEQMMGGELIGVIIIEPGEREELVLVNLPPGTYLLADALVQGSAAVLTITEPVPES